MAQGDKNLSDKNVGAQKLYERVATGAREWKDDDAETQRQVDAGEIRLAPEQEQQDKSKS